MYFMPASLAMRTHSSGSYFVGLNRLANCAYCARDIPVWSMNHSERSRRPCHSPAGTEYRPQWMNMPKRASVHHLMRAAFCCGVSAGTTALETDGAAAVDAAVATDATVAAKLPASRHTRTRHNRVFMNEPRAVITTPWNSTNRLR